MKIRVIADDFTGASYIALTLADAGMRTAQFVGVPTHNALGIEADVVALKSRTIAVTDAVRLSVAACDWLIGQGAEQIIFKVCSTFDSTANGNIGPVAAALADRLGETHVLTCPAFPENGRSVYQRHLFVSDVLLSESGMQDHPLTPMTDADLRRVLAAQTDWAVTHVPMAAVRKGAKAIADAVNALPPSMVVLDAIGDDDFFAIGKAAVSCRLVTGGSGIALGFPANFGAKAAPPDWHAETGPGVILAGSCSRATREQIQRYCAIAPRRDINAADAMNGVDIPALVSWVMTQDAPPLVYTSAAPSIVGKSAGCLWRR